MRTWGKGRGFREDVGKYLRTISKNISAVCLATFLYDERLRKMR